MASCSSSTTCLLLFVFTLWALVLVASSSEENIDLTITLPLTSTFSSKLYREKTSAFIPDTNTASLSQHGKTSKPSIKTPLFSSRYGYHYIYLSFGTPPQNLSFIMDTGGYAVEVPCTSNYECINCPFAISGNSKIPIFYPEQSSSSKILDCRDPKCAPAHSIDVDHLRCPRCDVNSEHCSDACPHYFWKYGKGSSRGNFLLENLNFPPKTIRNFLLACTTNAADQEDPAVVAGFDRSPVSLPAQMGVNKFAYCLNSHRYDTVTTTKTGKLILDYRGGETIGLSHAPFLKNPPQHPNYYYLGVEDIKIGDKPLRIPSKYLSPGSDGSNGVVINSGFRGAGYMSPPIFEMATNELKRQLSKYRRSRAAETASGRSPCYDFTGHKYMKIPDLTFQFRGTGAHLAVPGWNHFVFDDEKRIACFYMITDTNKSSQFAHGPSIILGNNAQVDYYLEYDLKNDRLGFRRQSC